MGVVTAKRLRLGKLNIDVLTFAGALDAVERLVEARQGGFVFTPNVDHIVMVEDQPEFEGAYQRASLSLADGAPVVWASRLFDNPLPERIAGSDLVGPLLELVKYRETCNPINVYLTQQYKSVDTWVNTQAHHHYYHQLHVAQHHQQSAPTTPTAD